MDDGSRCIVPFGVKAWHGFRSGFIYVFMGVQIVNRADKRGFCAAISITQWSRERASET